MSLILAKNKTFTISVAMLVVTSYFLCASSVSAASLMYGTKGSEVLAIQQQLVAQQYLTSDSATGYFGKLTRAALFATTASIPSGSTVTNSVTTTGGAGNGETSSLIAALLAQVRVLQEKIA